MLSCCKCLPENLQNVQKMHCWQKALGVNGLTLLPNAYLFLYIMYYVHVII